MCFDPGRSLKLVSEVAPKRFESCLQFQCSPELRMLRLIRLLRYDLVDEFRPADETARGFMKPDFKVHFANPLM